MRRELLNWNDIDGLIDNLLKQFDIEFEAMVMITHGGIIPGGLLAESMGISAIFTAAVDFPTEMEVQRSRLRIWPKFLQFPDDSLIDGRQVLVIDDVWGSGRTITAVKSRISGVGGLPHTCVLHFNPYRNLFINARPDYYAAITDAFIVYPWEARHGGERMFLKNG